MQFTNIIVAYLVYYHTLLKYQAHTPSIGVFNLDLVQ